MVLLHFDKFKQNFMAVKQTKTTRRGPLGYSDVWNTKLYRTKTEQKRLDRDFQCT